jgi:hypothetical protein
MFQENKGDTILKTVNFLGFLTRLSKNVISLRTLKAVSMCAIASQYRTIRYLPKL